MHSEMQNLKKEVKTDHYYEVTIITCKGSIERAKMQIDKMCTLRTLLPQYFGNYDIKNVFENMSKVGFVYMLPKLTDDHYRVSVTKAYETEITPALLLSYFRSLIITSEYLKNHEYNNGFIVIVDFTAANVLEYVTKLGPIELKQIVCLLIDGFGMRIKGIHFVTQSKLINTLATILKQVVSPKIASRIYVHKTIDEIHEKFSYIPRSILPKDYGGDERSERELIAEWTDILSTDEHWKYMQEINAAATDETFRQKDKFNEQFAGMPGTFRLLSID